MFLNLEPRIWPESGRRSAGPSIWSRSATAMMRPAPRPQGRRTSSRTPHSAGSPTVRPSVFVSHARTSSWYNGGNLRPQRRQEREHAETSRCRGAWGKRTFRLRGALEKPSSPLREAPSASSSRRGPAGLSELCSQRHNRAGGSAVGRRPWEGGGRAPTLDAGSTATQRAQRPIGRTRRRSRRRVRRDSAAEAPHS